MAKNQDDSDIVSIPVALKSIEKTIEKRMLWMVKAQTLLEFVGQIENPKFDRAKFIAQCKEHADSIPV